MGQLIELADKHADELQQLQKNSGQGEVVIIDLLYVMNLFSQIFSNQCCGAGLFWSAPGTDSESLGVKSITFR